MAHPAHVRSRAEQLYVTRGLSFARVSAETGVSKTTLLRWAARSDWARSRAQREQLQTVAVDLALELARSAQSSGDPQQVYAAMQAAELAGVREGPAQRMPSPARLAEALMDVLVRHPEIGPLVRRERRTLIGEVLREAERLEQRLAVGGGAV